MNAAVAAIREQNRLLQQQNELLMQLTEREELPCSAPQESRTGRMMTDHDLQLILMSDNILEAIDRWNAHCGYGRNKRRART